jgi:hypothetical protein
MSNFDRERAEIERQSGRGNRNDDGRQGVTEQNVWDKVIDKNGGYQGMRKFRRNLVRFLRTFKLFFDSDQVFHRDVCMTVTFDPFQELLDARKFSETPKEPMSPHQAETKLASPA